MFTRILSSILLLMVAARTTSAQVTVEVWRGSNRTTLPSVASGSPISLNTDADVTRVNVFSTTPGTTNIGPVTINAAAPVDLFLGEGVIPFANLRLTAVGNGFAGLIATGAPVRFSGAWGGDLTGPISVTSIVRVQTLADIAATITTTNAGSLSTIDLGWLDAARISNGATVQTIGSIGEVVLSGTGTALDGSITSTNGAINRLDIERGEIGTPASPAAVTAFEEIGTLTVGSFSGGVLQGGDVFGDITANLSGNNRVTQKAAILGGLTGELQLGNVT